MSDGTALAERIAERRDGSGDPRELVGELRRAGNFDGFPRSIEKAVGNNPGFIAGIRKGLAALGEG